jgi:phosphatidylserine/phosphatidylglycerophosphate/cardiolipin synthase-like enzyme/uncharacterized membrane protein YdjX (TVP38/TMEM64 family)
MCIDEYDMNTRPVLVPGSNCWRRAHANRVAFLVDSGPYFTAVAGALERAQRSVFLLGWDFHSRVCMRRDGKSRDWPDDFVGLLNAAVERNRKLHIHILEWDFYMVYAREREFLPLLRLGRRTHRRVQFRLDDRYPSGGSHHQKIIVVDDAVAFSGGIDVTACRWDTPEHRPEDPRRCDPGYAPYGPFHDVSMAVDGEAAAALGDLARERWHRAGGRRVRRVYADGDPWPQDLAADVEDVEVAIARTEPEYDGREETREVERSYLDAIAVARRSIYIENQYITAYKVREALAERLREKDGPEVVIVAPRECTGWLEHRTMGALREIFLRQLREVDRHGHLRIFYPAHKDGPTIFIHSKLMIVDDRIVRVGSANLANRSMGLDTECDLLIESQDNPRVAEAVAAFRNRLLGEHLGADPIVVAKATHEKRSLIGAIESLRGGARTLEPIEPCAPGWLEDFAGTQAIFDPERPVSLEQLELMLVPNLPDEGLRTAAAPGVAVLAVVALGVVWYWTPLRDWLTPEYVVGLAAPLRASSAGPFLWGLTFVAAALLMMPLTVLVVASALLYGPTLGASISLAAGVASSVAGYWLGRSLWRDTVRRLAGPRLNRISREVGAHGLLSVVAVRLVPIAPFTVVNMVAGASHVGLRDFALGTALGIMPGIIGLSALSNRAAAAVSNPDAASVAILVVVAVFFGAVLVWLRRRVAATEGAEEAAT